MTRPDYQVTDLIMEIHKIPLHGNITPLPWFHHITHKNGKPNLVAITILSDIVYWYRPTEVRDEETGNFVGWKSKFKGDMLQRSYKQLSERFGITRTQAKDAVDYLISINVLQREFRTIEQQGVISNNVMFIAPISEGIRKISESEDKKLPPPRIEPRRGSDTSEEPSRIYPKTNTYTSSNTTTEINQSSMHGDEPEPEPTQPQQAPDMHGVDVVSKNPSYRLLKEYGIRSEKVLAELAIVPIETIQAEWALVKNSTMPAHYKPNQLAKNLRSWLVDQAANPEPVTIPVSDPKPEHPSIARSDWQDLGRYDRSQALSQYMDDVKAWNKRNEGRA